MAALAAYLDECVRTDLAETLRARGFTVTTALAEGQTGADDRCQLAYAADHQWILVTHNRNDFLRLHQTYLRSRRTHAGLIIVPQTSVARVREVRIAMLLTSIGTLPEEQRQSALFTWGHLQALLETGLRPGGYSEADVHLALGRA